MKVAVSVGNSRMDKKWNLQVMELDAFSRRLAQTTKTAETVSQYRALTKAGQDSIKDVGGFVMGRLKGGRRRKNCVMSRSALTLDMDHGTPRILEELEMLCTFRCILYSTHRHTKELPRLRLIIPLLREVTADEYGAVSRKVAQSIGIELFDDTTYEPSRLMYWPSTSSDGEFVYEDIPGALLDPDVILATYKDWHDVSSWPVSQRQTEVVQRAVSKQADPLAKAGIVGAFCRAYPVTAAIDHFLVDVYRKSEMLGRYDYIPGEGQAGVVIYEDKWAYSHHATDPACGKLLNAFDIVRVHLFGDKDGRCHDDAEPTKLPSYKAMVELAVQDDQVKRTLADDRLARAADEFKRSDEWQQQLELDKTGAVKDTLPNLVAILMYDARLSGIAFNLHRDGIDVQGELPWKQLKNGWSDSDNAALKVYLNNIYGLYSPAKTKDAVLSVAATRAYHPIRDFLEQLPVWDGVHRVDTLLIDYFGADGTSYTRAVIRKTLVAAVARIYHPGTKFDSVLILNGPQGIGKSTFFARLAGRWFSDSLTITDMRDKSGPEKLQGYWILELSELNGMRKMDVEIVKSFITRMDDKYRASYGLNVESHPRQSVIIGTTNAETGFLRDITGNRRFWPVPISGISPKKPWQLSQAEIQQIWAEVLAIYHQGETLYLEGCDAHTALALQAGAMETDEREGLVREYLDTLLPSQWDGMSLYERRSFLSGGEFGSTAHTGTEQRTLVCNMEIWCECFGKEAPQLKKSDSYEISAIMQKMEGWRRYHGNQSGTHHFPLYGNQRAMERVE